MLARLEQAIRRELDESDFEHLTIQVVPTELGGLYLELCDDDGNKLAHGQGRNLMSAVDDLLSELAEGRRGE